MHIYFYTTDTLIRYISLRVLCSDLFYDCGTNFTGDATQLNNIMTMFRKNHNFQHDINRLATEQNIKFHFIPFTAVHQDFGKAGSRVPNTIFQES